MLLSLQAQYRIAADGAANSYLNNRRAVPGNFAVRKAHLVFLIAPKIIQCLDAICGDMDSISDETYNLYSNDPNINIIVDTDQYSTDFMKCLRHASEEADGILDSYEAQYNEQWGLKRERVPALDVAVLGGLDGRADQAFSQIHHLYSASEDFGLNLGDIHLFADNSIMFLLQKGMNIIQTPVKPGFLTEDVGIIPIGRPSMITTKGLEWDVVDWSTEFGTQISTSNHIKAKTVRVKTTERVLFTVELAEMEDVPASHITEKKNEINERGGTDLIENQIFDEKDNRLSSKKGEKEKEREESKPQSKKRKFA